MYAWHGIRDSSSDPLTTFLPQEDVSSSLRRYRHAKQVLVYKVLGWYPINRVLGYSVTDQNDHGPSGTKCRSSRNSFWLLKLFKIHWLVHTVPASFLLDQVSFLCTTCTLCCIKNCLSSPSWHQSGIKAQSWHKVDHSSGWFDRNMVTCPCLICRKPVLLLEALVHRSGVNLSLW